MTRLGALILLAAAFNSSAAQDPPPAGKPPAEEYEERCNKITTALADEHANVGAYLTSAQMHDWARIEYNNAIKQVPLHEKANKGLGYTVWNEEDKKWETDPSKIPQTGNRKKGEEADKVWTEYQKRTEQLGKKIGRLYFELGTWCVKNLAAEKDKSESAFRRAIQYDPLSKDARTKLGHQKQKDGGWLSPEEVKLRKEMKEGIAKAPKGSADASPSDFADKLGLKTKKQAAEHLVVESPHLDQKALETLVQHAEHAYAMFLKMFNQNSLFEGKRTLLILKDKGQHEKYVDTFGANWSSEQRKLSKECIGTGNERYQGEHPQAQLEDWVIHRVIMMCSEAMAGGERHWLHEGLAYHFTRQMHDSCMTHCTSLRGTGAGDGGKDYSDSTTWHILIREWLKSGKDPDIFKIFKCRTLAELKGGDPVKSWSLCEFLAVEWREKLIDFMQKLRAVKQEEDEKTFEAVFGWTLPDFDNRWKVYARAVFMDAK